MRRVEIVKRLRQYVMHEILITAKETISPSSLWIYIRRIRRGLTAERSRLSDNEVT
jgi:hypothetical protein